MILIVDYGMSNLRSVANALQAVGGEPEPGAGKPILGLCPGMQLLGDRSFEHGEFPGLGWIPGQVRRLEPADPRRRVPHLGWSSVT